MMIACEVCMDWAGGMPLRGGMDDALREGTNGGKGEKERQRIVEQKRILFSTVEYVEYVF